MASPTVAKKSVLSSWKEIAVYLSKGVRTVQRWERELELPVHRIRNSAKSPVFAFKTELDKWMRDQGGVLDSDNAPASDSRGSTSPSRDYSGAVHLSVQLTAHALHLLDEQQTRTRQLIEQVRRMAGNLEKSAVSPFVARQASPARSEPAASKKRLT